MNEMLQEFVDSRGVKMRVDRGRGVILGVKILGFESRNGRTYLPDALTQAARLYERAKVNVNHPKGSPLAPRDYQDRIGVIRNVATRQEEGLFADFYFNPKHTLAEQLVWDAEHAPENVGFSHNVQARTARQGDRVVVEAITKVQSVDLVADPATTRGLFESATNATGSNHVANLAELTSEDLKRHRPELVEELLAEQADELNSLQEEVDRLRATEAVRQKRLVVRRLLSEFHLPDPDTAQGSANSIVSPRFIESLLASPDEQAMRELVEERAQLVQSASGRVVLQAPAGTKPRCVDQNQIDEPGPADCKSFVAAIT